MRTRSLAKFPRLAAPLTSESRSLSTKSSRPTAKMVPLLLKPTKKKRSSRSTSTLLRSNQPAKKVNQPKAMSQEKVLAVGVDAVAVVADAAEAALIGLRTRLLPNRKKPRRSRPRRASKHRA